MKARDDGRDAFEAVQAVFARLRTGVRIGRRFLLFTRPTIADRHLTTKHIELRVLIERQATGEGARRLDPSANPDRAINDR